METMNQPIVGYCPICNTHTSWVMLLGPGPSMKCTRCGAVVR